VPVSSVL